MMCARAMLGVLSDMGGAECDLVTWSCDYYTETFGKSVSGYRWQMTEAYSTEIAEILFELWGLARRTPSSDVQTPGFQRNKYLAPLYCGNKSHATQSLGKPKAALRRVFYQRQIKPKRSTLRYALTKQNSSHLFTALTQRLSTSLVHTSAAHRDSVKLMAHPTIIVAAHV